MPEKTHSGVIKVVNKINSIEMPSIPSLKSIKSLSHFFSSRNWKLDVDVSNEYHKNKDSKKFVKEVNIATYFELFSTTLGLPLITKINSAPINGINIIVDKIGKFII